MEYKDMEIASKSTKVIELQFSKNGSSQDITGWTIYFTVKDKIADDDDDAKIKKDITVHSEPENGITLIELTTSDTNLVGNYYYDIKFKDTDGNNDVLFHGRIKFIKTVTTRG